MIHLPVTDVEVLLRAIGKRVFVEYYDLFKSSSMSSADIADHLPSHYTLSSRRSRVSKARRIFSDGLHIEALRNVASSERVDQVASELAQEILQRECSVVRADDPRVRASDDRANKTSSDNDLSIKMTSSGQRSKPAMGSRVATAQWTPPWVSAQSKYTEPKKAHYLVYAVLAIIALVIIATIMVPGVTEKVEAARALYARGEYASAVEKYTTILDDWKDSRDYDFTKEQIEAEKSLSEAFIFMKEQDFPSLSAKWQDVLRLAPEHRAVQNARTQIELTLCTAIDALLEDAREHYISGDYVGAVEEYEAVLTVWIDGRTFDSTKAQVQAEKCLSEAFVHLSKMDYASAAKKGQEALNLAPELQAVDDARRQIESALREAADTRLDAAMEAIEAYNLPEATAKIESARQLLPSYNRINVVLAKLEAPLASLSTKNTIGFLRTIIEGYGASLGDYTSITTARDYISGIDSSGYTKSRTNGHVIELEVWTKDADKANMQAIAYDLHKTLYTMKKNFTLATVIVYFRHKDYQTSAQVTIGYNTARQYFTVTDKGAAHFFDWVHQREQFENAYIEDDRVAHSSGYVNEPINWLRAAGNIWVGVKLYYGGNAEKMYVGQVLAMDDKHYDPVTGDTFRGVKLLMKGGAVEWKDRDAIIRNAWYVRADDPALNP